jgi:hypothetical protein
LWSSPLAPQESNLQIDHHVLYESSLPETEAEEVGFEPTFSN